MQLAKIAWRPFRSYRQEESGTKTHLVDTLSKTGKCVCGAEYSNHGDLAPFSPSYCKRCLRIVRNKGVTNDEIKAAAYLKIRDLG